MGYISFYSEVNILLKRTKVKEQRSKRQASTGDTKGKRERGEGRVGRVAVERQNNTRQQQRHHRNEKKQENSQTTNLLRNGKNSIPPQTI